MRAAIRRSRAVPQIRSANLSRNGLERTVWNAVDYDPLNTPLSIPAHFPSAAATGSPASQAAGRPDVLQEWYSFDYKELFAATDGFSVKAVLGKGACSTVYKGTLVDGAVVAVKVLGGSSWGMVSQTGSVNRDKRPSSIIGLFI